MNLIYSSTVRADTTWRNRFATRSSSIAWERSGSCVFKNALNLLDMCVMMIMFVVAVVATLLVGAAFSQLRKSRGRGEIAEDNQSSELDEVGAGATTNPVASSGSSQEGSFANEVRWWIHDTREILQFSVVR